MRILTVIFDSIFGIVKTFEAVFLINRASFTVNRLNVTANFDSPLDDHEFHRVVY